jgi:hypothetical protein
LDKTEEKVMAGGYARPVGVLQCSKVIGIPSNKLTFKEVLYWTMPHGEVQGEEVWKWRVANAPRILNQLWKLQVMKAASRVSGYPFMYGTLWVRKLDGLTGQDTLFGIASFRVITTVGRDEIVDEFDAATAAGFDLTTFNFHGLGTGVTAEAVGDTALVTELTTEYTGNVRATGVQTQPTSDVYRTVGVNTLDSGTPTVTEHGIFSASSAGTLLDRSLTGAFPLVGTNGDGLQTTYNLTIASGG